MSGKRTGLQGSQGLESHAIQHSRWYLAVNRRFELAVDYQG
jgi:hypothetical protein